MNSDNSAPPAQPPPVPSPSVISIPWRRLHLGNGQVYWHGYINIDVPYPGIRFLASDRPDLVEANGVHWPTYYKLDYAAALAAARQRLHVCDMYLPIIGFSTVS